MFKLDFDDRRRLFSLTLAGFWSEDDALGFVRAVGRAVDGIEWKIQDTVVLLDISDWQVQSQSVVEIVKRLTAKSAKGNSKGIAIVTTRVLSRMQAKRFLIGSHSRLFDSYDAANDWLKSL